MKTQKFHLPAMFLVVLVIFCACDTDSFIETPNDFKPGSSLAGINHDDSQVFDLASDRETAESTSLVDELKLVTTITSEVIRHNDRPAPDNPGPGAVPQTTPVDDYYTFVLDGEGHGVEKKLGTYQITLSLTSDVKERNLSGTISVESQEMGVVTYSIWGSNQFSEIDGEAALKFRIRVEKASTGFSDLSEWGIGEITGLSELFEDKSTIRTNLTIMSGYN